MEPRYWRAGDGHICLKGTCSKDAVPIIGNFIGNEALEVLKWITAQQETGLERDQYKTSIEPKSLFSPEELALTTDEKRAVLMQRKKEKPVYYLSDIYKGLFINQLKEFASKAQTFFSNGRIFSGSLFLPLSTPIEFNYMVSFIRK